MTKKFQDPITKNDQEKCCDCAQIEMKIPYSCTQEHGKISKESPDFEQVLAHLGGFGCYQFFILVLLLILEVPTAFVTFIPIFVGQVPELWSCAISSDSANISVQSIQDICSCNGTKTPFGFPPAGSIIAEWGLICEKEWVFDFITSIQMLGMFFGSIFGSQFADWHGRKSGFLVSTLLLSFGSVLSFSAINPYVYAVARFICGAGITSFMNVTLVSVVEVMPTSWRSFSNSIGPTGEGIMILSLLAYYIREWRHLYWATISPFFLILVIYPFVPESPRWLMKQGRLQEAFNVFKLMAKMNRRPEVEIQTLEKILENEKSKERESLRRWTFLDFVKDPKLRVTSIYNMAIWFAWSLTYYGISFNIKNVQGNVYLNVFLMGTVNCVGQRSAILINNRLGRRKALFVSTTFSAVSLVVLATTLIFIDVVKIPSVVVSLCLLGQFGMASARSAARLLSGESFPTSMRTMGMGLGGITANIAGILTPQLAYVGKRWEFLPFFTFAFVSVGGALVAFLMSETMGKPLDHDDDESEGSKAVGVEENKSCGTADNPAFILDEASICKGTNLRSSVVLVSIQALAEATDQANYSTNNKVL